MLPCSKSLKIVLLSFVALTAFLFGCQSEDHGQSSASNPSIVLDTSSPDEQGFQPQEGRLTAATVTNLFLHTSDSNKTLSNVTLKGTSYTGPIVISDGKDSLKNIVYQRWSISNDYANGMNAKWGILLYNEENCIYRNVRVWGMKAEHAIYQHNPKGNVLLSYVTVFDVGAQGWQQVSRGAEGNDPLGYLVTGTHRLEHCSFIKCGQPRGWGRASYAVSFFGRQQGGGSTPREFWNCPVELDDVTIEHDSQGAYELRGALLCEWRPSLTITNSRINYVGTSDRDGEHVHEVEIVKVSNTYIHNPAGKFFDIDGAKSVTFTSPGFDGGDAPVRINGILVGTTDDEINWHN